MTRQLHQIMADNLDDGNITYWDTDSQDVWDWLAGQAERHFPYIIYFFVDVEETTDIWEKEESKFTARETWGAYMDDDLFEEKWEEHLRRKR